MRKQVATIPRTLALCGLSAVVVTAAHGQKQRPAPDAVVVTAPRVEQSRQRTPVSVTALDASAIERFQIDNVEDVSQVVPNVTIRPVTGGSAGITPYVRGGSVTDGANITSEPEVGIYIDDVFQPRAAASFIEALDIERIEVLRGPQGTLYGRNSSAGALKIITRRPGREPRLKVEAGVGIWDETYGKLNLSGPLSDDGRLRGGISGIVRDRGTGRQDTPTLGGEVGEEEYQGAQGELYFVDERWDVRLQGYFSDYDSDGLYVSAVEPFSLALPYDELPYTSGDIDTVVTPFPSYTETEQYGVNLHVTRALGETGTVTSITAWSELEDSFAVGFSGGVRSELLGLPPGGFVELFERDQTTDQDSFSQELRIDGTASGGLIDYLAGLYYFRESGTQTVFSRIFFAPAFTEFDIETDSYAAFGQLAFNVTEDLTLTVGGRYTEDRKSIDGEILATAVARDDTFSEFTPTLSAEYQFNEQLFLYASYTEGFKAGGYNGLAATPQALSSPFDTQTVGAYEVGLKAELWDQRLRANVAGFFNDYQDLQQQSVTADGVFITENYDAEHTGLEAEVSAQVTPALYLFASAVYQDSEYTDASAAGGEATGALLGNSMVSVFDTQFTLGFDYTRDIGPGTLALGANINVKDDFYATPDNAKIGRVEQTELLDAYLSYKYDRWEVRLAGKNLTDQDYWFTGFGFSLVQARFMADPRTWRLSVSYAF